MTNETCSAPEQEHSQEEKIDQLCCRLESIRDEIEELMVEVTDEKSECFQALSCAACSVETAVSDLLEASLPESHSH